MDETGFRVGVGKTHWVITAETNKPLLLTDPDNRDYLTSCETINEVGGDIPPMLIIQGVNILEKWGVNNLDEDILLATSPTGYSNDNLAVWWLEHFNKHTKKTQIGDHRMLILDGFGSHMTYEFWQFAKRKRILLFRLPPHSTHLTQPLDVGIFQPFKHHHTEAIDAAVRAGNMEFSKLDFLASFQAIRASTFTKSSILSAWKNTGLIPYNPNVVLAKIEAIQASNRPASPPPPSVPPSARTPHTIQELIIHGKKLQTTMKKLQVIDKDFQVHVERFIKGSITSAHTLQITERDLLATRQEAVARVKRKVLKGNVAQKGGVITVKEVRRKTVTRMDSEVEKQKRALTRAENKEKREQAVLDKKLAKAFKAIWKELKEVVKAREARLG